MSVDVTFSDVVIENMPEDHDGRLDTIGDPFVRFSSTMGHGPRIAQSSTVWQYPPWNNASAVIRIPGAFSDSIEQVVPGEIVRISCQLWDYDLFSNDDFIGSAEWDFRVPQRGGVREESATLTLSLPRPPIPGARPVNVTFTVLIEHTGCARLPPRLTSLPSRVPYGFCGAV